ncbi:putative calcium-dependent protein kinase 9-like [Apostichopus japonicus]|uniref:Putative calcium-dependent protein kinase 9-like n=1 Tax=Stichopus japonicus TaxID=307972 RepID=A0A2G8JP98_STIJA|nr:putative calcium-dependent protein kinase 9-like [Apostichopus japonicus]
MSYLEDLLEWTFPGAPMDQYYVIIKCSQLFTGVTHCFTIMEVNHGPCLHLVMSTLPYIANQAICLSRNYFHLLRDSFIFLDNIGTHIFPVYRFQFIMGRKLFRRRQVKNKQKRQRGRRSPLNKIFWWFACLKSLEQDVTSTDVSHNASTIDSYTSSGGYCSVSDSEIIHADHPSDVTISIDDPCTGSHLSSQDNKSSDELHVSSVCERMGLSNVPYIPPGDLEENFVREVRVLTALQGLECIPTFFGVTLPPDDGPFPAIVQEFVTNGQSYTATSLYDATEKHLITKDKSLQTSSVADDTEDLWDDVDSVASWEPTQDIYPTESNPNFKIKLIDFGLTLNMNDEGQYLQFTDERQAEVMKNSIHVAPEVITGQRPFSKASDVFSIGRVLKDLSVVGDDFLMRLGDQCMKPNPDERPKLDDVIDIINVRIQSVKIPTCYNMNLNHESWC